ncbi:MAG TPA: hypothetical protein DEQ40_01055 [Oxalobacteraceae bacterium]|nr:hypothetical protein [Oxalobacteraceae bacterium]
MRTQYLGNREFFFLGVRRQLVEITSNATTRQSLRIGGRGEDPRPACRAGPSEDAFIRFDVKQRNLTQFLESLSIASLRMREHLSRCAFTILTGAFGRFDNPQTIRRSEAMQHLTLDAAGDFVLARNIKCCRVRQSFPVMSGFGAIGQRS